MIRTTNSKGKNLDWALLNFVVAYKSTLYATTSMMPYAMLFGQEMRTKLSMSFAKLLKLKTHYGKVTNHAFGENSVEIYY